MRATIRRFSAEDVGTVAEIHAEAFARQSRSREWIACNAAAYPRIRLYVADIDNQVRGYAMWTEKSGFRTDVVLELEQIAVAASDRGRGIGETLIIESLSDVTRQLAERAATLRAVLVSTRADNAAQRLYRRALGADVEATIASLYSGDEVLMIGRRK